MSRGGFTLIELLVTMVIVALLAAAVVSTFAAGLQVWQTTQRQTDGQQTASAVLETVGRDLRTTLYLPPSKKTTTGEEDIPPFILEPDAGGDAYNSILSFTTLVSSRDFDSLPSFRRVAYRLSSQEGALMRLEEPVLTEAARSALQMETPEPEVVSDTVKVFHARCWNGDSWSEIWPHEEPTVRDATTEATKPPHFPHIIEITLELDLPESQGPQTVRAYIPMEMAHP